MYEQPTCPNPACDKALLELGTADGRESKEVLAGQSRRLPNDMAVWVEEDAVVLDSLRRSP